jgi:arabinose-5-phosphate isomerase
MDVTQAATAKTSLEDDLAVARRVLRTEAAALEALALELDERLPRALDILTRDGGGRVIVTGMGKSGHVGRKIAATLASTGTPAQYVHPGEASHGDLGMITPHDAILALSNSGETAELSDVIDYSRRFGIPLVVVTARAESALAQASDLAIM